MDYPRRFYRRGEKGEKKLRYEEKLIHSCNWCGTFFVDYDEKKFCSKRCESQALFWGIEKPRKERERSES